ncbi:MAG: M48 family metallopeptidase [Treponema sp.]|jgi:Zn-dependent protease with chaperone function|nr:M48 family metallopeptidase [Treponema sp.]
MNYSVRKSENILFAIKIIATVVIILCIVLFLSKAKLEHLASISAVIIYILIILLYFWFYKVYLVAYMKGNGICISETQFSNIFELYCDMARNLEIKKIPPLFILQQGGLLNAFAIRLSGRNYIAIYSDILSLYKNDIEAVKFVLAHELGHVKRKHNQKRFWTFPSSIIPFLTAAYSRACEYTCDNIGGSFIPDETSKLQGLLLLAGGRDIYKEIDINNYLETAKQNRSFAVNFVNMFISHPYLPDRIRNLQKKDIIRVRYITRL